MVLRQIWAAFFQATVMDDFCSRLDDWAPIDSTAPEPEMRPAFLLSPNRRVKCYRAIGVTGEPPAGAFVGNQVHLQGALAAAGTKHGSLLYMTSPGCGISSVWQSCKSDNHALFSQLSFFDSYEVTGPSWPRPSASRRRGPL